MKKKASELATIPFIDHIRVLTKLYEHEEVLKKTIKGKNWIIGITNGMWAIVVILLLCMR